MVCLRQEVDHPSSSRKVKMIPEKRFVLHRRSLVLGGILILSWPSASVARQWTLIEKDEFERERAAPRSEGALPLPPPGAPVIKVDQPDDAKPVTVPVTIRLSFHPQSGATIDVSTFRVTYGFLGIDITSRILANATVTASGLVAEKARLPSGQHIVTIQISDNMQRVGTHTISFTVL